MSKSKSNVERILGKIKGEIYTAEKYADTIRNSDIHIEENYFDGKVKFGKDIETWITENIINEEG